MPYLYSCSLILKLPFYQTTFNTQLCKFFKTIRNSKQHLSFNALRKFRGENQKKMHHFRGKLLKFASKKFLTNFQSGISKSSLELKRMSSSCAKLKTLNTETLFTLSYHELLENFLTAQKQPSFAYINFYVNKL